MPNFSFASARELLALCEENHLPVWAVMRRRELAAENAPGSDAVDARMRHVWATMCAAAKTGAGAPQTTAGGLIGGGAYKLAQRYTAGPGLAGPVLSRAMTYAMAVLEVNAGMGLIVAAPTAGAAGVVPGVLLAMQEVCDLPEETVLNGLWTAGAVGYLAMRNATVAGAVGGCQAEVGVAAAMAAAAAVEMMGGAPAACLDAAAMVLMNMLGLVCDPVGGLVEVPCQNRNAAGAANAIAAAELALAGVPQLIPLDEMLSTMYAVGRRIPKELRETSLGGCAAAPSACRACGGR